MDFSVRVKSFCKMFHIRKTHFSIISFYSDTNERKECINFGSFDYMGFNEIVQDQFSELSSIIEKYGITTCSSHLDCGKLLIFLLHFLLYRNLVIYSK